MHIRVFELRDPSWFILPVREILERFGLGFCIFDMPDMFCSLWVTSSVVYLRFHGVVAIYAGSYGQSGLKPWANRIRQWLAEGRTVFAYFNNNAFGHVVKKGQPDGVPAKVAGCPFSSLSLA